MISLNRDNKGTQWLSPLTKTWCLLSPTQLVLTSYPTVTSLSNKPKNSSSIVQSTLIMKNIIYKRRNYNEICFSFLCIGLRERFSQIVLILYHHRQPLPLHILHHHYPLIFTLPIKSQNVSVSLVCPSPDPFSHSFSHRLTLLLFSP